MAPGLRTKVRTIQRRKEGWDGALTHHLNAHRETEFELGYHDCAQFAIGAEIAMCGSTQAPELYPGPDGVPAYTTREEWAALLSRLGYGGISSLLDDRYPPLRAPSLASRGDVGLFETVEGPALMVNAGRMWAGVFSRGLLMARPSQITGAWRVGC